MKSELQTERKPGPAIRQNSIETFEVVPSGKALGAEIRGVNLALDVPEAVRAALRKAWADHLVIRFRGQDLTDDHLAATAEIFGGVQESASRAYYLRAGLQQDHRRISTNPNVNIVSNLDANGKPALDNGTLGSYELAWHSDNSYAKIPPAGSMLYSLEVPVNGGGDTSFNNQYRSWEELPEDLRSAAQGKFLAHDNSRNSAGYLRPSAKLPTTPEEVEGPRHPIARVHPVTGKMALYLGRRREWPSSYIVGMSNSESEAVLDKLWAHATQDKYKWTHQWRVGDLLLWDNRCAMHSRELVDAKQARVMHRVVVKGEPVISPW